MEENAKTVVKEYVGLYDIRGFRSVTDGQPSMAGFSIVLAGPVAQALAAVPRHPGAPIWKELEMLAQMSGPKISTPDQAAFVYGESALLERIRLPWGNCCCLGVDGSMQTALRRGGNVKYSPHNVDTVQQATTILSIWLTWFECVISQVDKEFQMPFAM